ncbi:MAG TPA: hypothetical protein VF017_08725 [Thermoanaerobaculia bacterium]|nr:hypothetical protein [Thermoanaerobaculia bacterium]
MSDPRDRDQDDGRRGQELLTTWLRGELDEDGWPELLAAAREDPELEQELAGYQRVLAGLEALPAALEPQRDLWPEIEARLESRVGHGAGSRALGRWPLALAASVLLAVGLFALLRPGDPGRPGEETGPLTSTPVAATPASNVPSAYLETDAALTAILLELRERLEARPDALPVETRRKVFDNLATIERAITEIETALGQEPGNAELARTYVRYRLRQIDLLRQANRALARL